MYRVILYEKTGGVAARLLLPPFEQMPPVIYFGDRFFQFLNERRGYVEVPGYVHVRGWDPEMKLEPGAVKDFP